MKMRRFGSAVVIVLFFFAPTARAGFWEQCREWYSRLYPPPSFKQPDAVLIEPTLASLRQQGAELAENISLGNSLAQRLHDVRGREVDRAEDTERPLVIYKQLRAELANGGISPNTARALAHEMERLHRIHAEQGRYDPSSTDETPEAHAEWMLRAKPSKVKKELDEAIELFEEQRKRQLDEGLQASGALAEGRDSDSDMETAIGETKLGGFLQREFGRASMGKETFALCRAVLEAEKAINDRLAAFENHAMLRSKGAVPPDKDRDPWGQKDLARHDLNSPEGERQIVAITIDLQRRLTALRGNQRLPQPRHRFLDRYQAYLDKWYLPIDRTQAMLEPLMSSLEKLYGPSGQN